MYLSLRMRILTKAKRRLQNDVTYIVHCTGGGGDNMTLSLYFHGTWKQELTTTTSSDSGSALCRRQFLVPLFHSYALLLFIILDKIALLVLLINKQTNSIICPSS